MCTRAYFRSSLTGTDSPARQPDLDVTACCRLAAGRISIAGASVPKVAQAPLRHCLQKAAMVSSVTSRRSSIRLFATSSAWCEKCAAL